MEEGSIFDSKGVLFEARGVLSKHYLEKERESIIRFVSSHDAEEAFKQCREIFERVHIANRARIAHGGLNESDTESELIDKLLPVLGFHFLHRTRQDAGGVPDYILFADEKSKDEALPLDDKERYRLAIGILEAKSFNKNLGSISKKDTPGLSYARQVRLYLSDAQDSSGNPFFEWAILTNGQDWRLYNRRTERDHHLTVDLRSALNNLEDFRFFLGLFHREAFTPDLQGIIPLDRWRAESESRQRELEFNLRKRIYVLVEWIAQGFYQNEFNKKQEMPLEKVYNASLILLYRLMFILCAEARELLPTWQRHRGAKVEYRRDYSLQRFIPLLREHNLPPEDDAHSRYWYMLTTLFEVIDGSNAKVSERLEISRYNGGLFDQNKYLELGNTRLGWRLGDWTVQETMKRLMFDVRPSRDIETIPLAHEETIDYSTLSVQQLGSIYEGLLEYKPRFTAEDRIEIRPDDEEKSERWLTGSYYTPNWVVDYILEETLRPLLDQIERSEAVQRAIKESLEDDSFAGSVLKLKILDPAMGSGHFLVRATEFLADEIVYHPTTKTVSPKRSGRISEADAEVAYWRRKVVESCIYGVDKNELAVELAKLSLWLTCISPAHPLSFLDHHLKHGDSLTGALLAKPNSKYKIEGLEEARRMAIQSISDIIELSSDKYEQVKAKEEKYESEVLSPLSPFEAILDEFTRRDFQLRVDEKLFAKTLEAHLDLKPLPRRSSGAELGWPLHFELAFPDVFPPVLEGGFDAVVGNPPYVRQENLGSLKLYLQRNYATYQGTADLYVYFVERAMNLLKSGGRFGMIFSNKWMRATYGSRLREYVRKYQIEKIVDFGELKVFDTSSTFPMIMTARNEETQTDPIYAPIRTLPKDANELIEMVADKAMSLGKEALDPSGFALVKKDLTDVFEKMKATGKPLGEYVDGKIYRGIITGFNEAFVITAEQRERFIDKDPKSAEIIVPFVKGDDVRKWRVNYLVRYLIFTRRGIVIEEYPAIEEFLSDWREQLTPKPNKTFKGKGRKPGDYKWFEIQDTIAYYDEFLKPKIVWPEIAKDPRFSFEPLGYYLNKTCFFHPKPDYSLLALLNSKAIWQYLLRTCPVLGDPDKAGRLTLQYTYIKTIPVPIGVNWMSIGKVAKSAMELKEKLAQNLLGLAERRRLESQLLEVERAIDRAVYELYGLTEKEIAIVEGRS